MINIWFLHIMNSNVTDIYIHVFMWLCLYFSWHSLRRNSWILRKSGSLRNCHYVFQGSHTILFFHQFWGLNFCNSHKSLDSSQPVNVNVKLILLSNLRWLIMLNVFSWALWSLVILSIIFKFFTNLEIICFIINW